MRSRPSIFRVDCLFQWLDYTRGTWAPNTELFGWLYIGN